MVGDKKIVALCTSRVYDPQVQSFIEAFNEKVKDQGIRVWIYALNADIYWEEDSDSAEIAIFDIIPYDLIDAVVLMDEKIKSHRIAERIIARAADRKLPVVVVDGQYPGTSDVRFDFAAGFEAVVRHILIDHGVKRPHFMGGIKGNVFSDEREEVFRSVLREVGIPFDESMVSYGEFWAAPALEAAKKLVKRPEIPDAIICANDIMAINVCAVLRESGYNVPEDVIVTGFDGFDEAFLSMPAITTVSCDSVQLAAASTEQLLGELSGAKPTSVRVVPKMYANESCGCPRCSEISNDLALKRFNNEYYRFQDDIRMIHSITTRMLSSETADKAVSWLRSDYTRNFMNANTGNLCCIVKSECLRTDVNYFLTQQDNNGGDYCLLYDAANKVDKVRPFDPKKIVPRLEKLLESGYPLIFQSLDYMGRSLGYLCYYMQSYDITDYARTPNITDMINMGLGGYINMRHQQYLKDKVEEMYRYDALTGLYNRLAFNEAIGAMKANPDYEGFPLTVLMIDLNHLKMINDTLGHEYGDKAIATVAVAMRASCPRGTLCVRFGGDEMLAFVPGDCDMPAIIDEIKRKLERESRKAGFTISASCGSYTTKVSADLDVEDAVRHADEEMYAVKRRERTPA
jgi:diguanylate cyclase (GGDEF)-like protein